MMPYILAPSQAEIRLHLAEEEEVNADDMGLGGVIGWLNMGLGIQQLQFVFIWKF